MNPPGPRCSHPSSGPRAETGYMGVQNEGEASGVFFKEVSYRHDTK